MGFTPISLVLNSILQASGSSNGNWTIGVDMRLTIAKTYLLTHAMMANIVSRHLIYPVTVNGLPRCLMLMTNPACFWDDAVYLSRADNRSSRGQAVRINPKTGTLLTEVVFSPNGQYVAWVQTQKLDAIYDNTVLFVQCRNQRNHNPRSRFGSNSILDPQWSADSNTIYVLVEEDADRNIYSFRLDGSQPTRITSGNTAGGIYPIDNTNILYVQSSTTSANAVFRYKLNDQTTETITHLNDEIYNSTYISQTEDFSFQTGGMVGYSWFHLQNLMSLTSPKNIHFLLFLVRILMGVFSMNGK